MPGAHRQAAPERDGDLQGQPWAWTTSALSSRKVTCFLFPTGGENFGHVILEALCAGCPVLVSDQTPWRDLEAKGVGWDYPLDEPQRFRSTIDELVGMGDAEFQRRARSAAAFGRSIASDPRTEDATRDLFRRGLRFALNESLPWTPPSHRTSPTREAGRVPEAIPVASAGAGARPRVVIAIDHYLPGANTGGPVRTVAATVERLGDEFEFVVLTGDRDRGDAVPYPGLAPGGVARVGKAEVRYLPSGRMRPLSLARLIGELRPGVVCLNGFFARTSRCTLVARRVGRLGGVPVIVAPRGDFSPGALALKR